MRGVFDAKFAKVLTQRDAKTLVGGGVPSAPYYITQRRRVEESTLLGKRLRLLARESLRTRSGFLLKKPASRSKLCSLRQNQIRFAFVVFSSPLRLCVRYSLLLLPCAAKRLPCVPWLKTSSSPQPRRGYLNSLHKVWASCRGAFSVALAKLLLPLGVYNPEHERQGTDPSTEGLRRARDCSPYHFCRSTWLKSLKIIENLLFDFDSQL